MTITPLQPPLEEIFPIPNQRWLTQPNLNNKKLTRPITSWAEPWPQSFRLDENLTHLLRGVGVHYLEHVLVIVAFHTGASHRFLFFPGWSDSVSSFSGSPCFSFMVWSIECFFIWKFCGHSNNDFERKILTTRCWSCHFEWKLLRHKKWLMKRCFCSILLFVITK